MYETSKKTINLDKILYFLVLFAILSVYALSDIRIIVLCSQVTLVSATYIYILYKKKLRLTIHFWWMITFIFWGLLCSLFAYNALYSSQDILNLVYKFLFYTSLILFIDDEDKFTFILKSIVFAGILLCLRLVLSSPMENWGAVRIGSEVALGLNANRIGMSLAYASIASVFVGKIENKKFYFIIVIPFIVIGLLTGSRKAFFTILGGISLLLILLIRKRKNFILGLGFSLFFIWALYYLIMNVPTLYNILGSRIESMGLFMDDSSIDRSTLTRVLMIEEAWRLFLQQPITGYGLESFRIISSFGTYSHNNYMELLTSTGIVGTLIYYSVPIGVLISSIIKRKNGNKKYSLVIVFLIIILLMDLGTVSYKYVLTQVILTISIGYYSILETKKSKYKVIQ